MKLQKVILGYMGIMFALCVSGCDGQRGVVTIYENGTIYTCEDSLPRAEAMVVSQGKILYVGGSENLKTYKKGKYKSVDLKGKTVLPGFVESHAHPACYGFMEAGDMIVIDGTATKQDILQQLKDYLKEYPDATHLLGQGYGLAYLGLAEGGTPTAKDLDEVSSTIPIMLYDEGCNSGWANSAALKLAGVDENTPDPLPGVHYYVRYPGTKTPTGYLCENTGHIVANAMPFNTTERVVEHLKTALDNYTDMGFTAVFDAGDIYNTTYQAVKQLQDNNELNLYYQKGYWADQTISVSDNIARLKELDKKYSDGNFYCNVYKMFEDGTIEAESASLIKPYTNSGKQVEPFFSEEENFEHVSAALSAGYAVHAHAIGDKGQRYILDTYLKTMHINPSLPRAIAHNQVFEPEAIGKYTAMKENLFCQTTPSWTVPDAVEETLKKLGEERFDRQYLWGNLTDNGVRVTFGSDYPANLIEEVNPFSQIYHAIMRLDSLSGYFPPCHAGLNIQHGIKAYTINAAQQMGLSDVTGSLKVGKNADFIIIDRDIFKCNLEDVKETNVLNTYFQGKKVK